MSETDVQDDGIGTHRQIQNILKGVKRKMEKLKNGIQIDEEEFGTIQQICDLETKGETIMNRENFSCMNPERSCDTCEYYHEIWNRMALINGLKWILEDNRFGFGEDWPKGSKPQNEEENAGYIICRVIEYLTREHTNRKKCYTSQ